MRHTCIAPAPRPRLVGHRVSRSKLPCGDYMNMGRPEDGDNGEEKEEDVGGEEEEGEGGNDGGEKGDSEGNGRRAK